MAKTMIREIKRISVALDDKSDELLNDLVSRKNMTVSDVVRLAIITYSELEGQESEIDIEKLKNYATLLYGGENVIVDIELWTCILDEINQKGSKEVWSCVKEIGERCGIQLKNMGMETIRDTLKYLEESTNWFTLKTNGGTSYTLVLRARNVGELLKAILESMFKAQEIPVKMTNGMRKITIEEAN